MDQCKTLPTGVVATVATATTDTATARRRHRALLAEDSVADALLSDLAASLAAAATASGSNETVPNVTASSEAGSDSPTIDLARPGTFRIARYVIGCHSTQKVEGLADVALLATS